jgi:serine/threonine-protein kinase RsbW
MLRTRTAPAFLLTVARPAVVLRADVRGPADLDRLTDRVLAAMEQAGYGERDRFAVRLCLDEAVANGLAHGNGRDRRKAVGVRCRIDADRVVISVEDEGPGFDPEQMPDPLAAENLEKPSGRGVLLMRHFMSSVRFSARGNRVTLCRRRGSD